MPNDLEQEEGRNPASDLALIREMMEAGKTRVAVSGIHFIIWGGVLMAAFFAQYLSVHRYLPPTILGVWIPAFMVGWGLEYIVNRGSERPSRKTNLPLLVHSECWGMVGIISLLYFTVSMVTNTFDPKIITSLNAATIGSAFWITGTVTAIRWLRGVAVGWFGLLIYTSVIPRYDDEMLLVMAAACGLLLLLPGFVLRRVTMTKG